MNHGLINRRGAKQLCAYELLPMLLVKIHDQSFDVTRLGEIPPADESIGLGHAYGAIVTQLSDQN